jgi:hypothetical protein
MNSIKISEQEQHLLRAGGLIGMLSSFLLIVVFVIVGVFVGPDPVELNTFVTQFPSIEIAKIFENGLYLLALILWIPHLLALYTALKTTSLASATFGMSIGIAGLVVLSAGALTHSAHGQMSDLYHAIGRTPEEQTSIALIWQAIWGIFDALLIAGLAFIPLSFLAFGRAMFNHPHFGRVIAGLSVVMGILGIGAIMISMVEPSSPTSAIIVFSMIIFHFVVGWKLISLSQSRTL